MQMATDTEPNKSPEYDALLKELKELFGQQEPPKMSQLQQLIHHLDVSEQDFAMEIELQRLREKAASFTRKNRELQQALDEADRQIGSLVRNCQIATDRKALKELYQQNVSKKAKARRTGLNEFTKEGRAKLEAYQQLFFTLQTQPDYLARLIVRVKSGKISVIRRTCLYTLFAYSTAPRESFYLTKMLEQALKEDILFNISKPSEVTTTDPVVLSLAIEFYRNSCLDDLSEVLKPLLLAIIHQTDLNLTLDPLSVYKAWLSEKEMETGVPSELSYMVEIEEALSHPEVKDRMAKNISSLIQHANEFLDVLRSEDFVERIPFGMRHIARCLWESLETKFPGTTKKELLKIISNILFYRFLGPCLTVPDSYFVLSTSPDFRVSKEARKNLAMVYKLLQAAAVGNKTFNFGSGFDPSGFYASLGLSLFLRDGHEKFTTFFREAIPLQNPEEFYNRTIFSDDAELFPPQLQLKLSEIMELHTWLWQYRHVLVPTAGDAMNVLLDACGPPPKNLSELFCPKADPRTVSSPGSKSNPMFEDHNLNSVIVTLNLVGRNVIHIRGSDTDSETSIRVKQAIVELIRYRDNCSDLNEILFKSVTVEEEEKYERAKTVFEQTASDEVKRRSILLSPFGDTLATMLNFARLNIKRINCLNFDEITKQITADIASKVEGREHRLYELEKLKDVVKSLQAKRLHNKNTLDYYKKYIKTCLENFQTKSKASTSNKSSTKKKLQEVISYSAKELKEKGILVSLADAETKQFKSIQFEIYPNEKNGQFTVKVKYHGMEIEKQVVEFQTLLQLQFEGIPVHNLFNKAKINVNLLIYLLNKKFYGKRK